MFDGLNFATTRLKVFLIKQWFLKLENKSSQPVQPENDIFDIFTDSKSTKNQKMIKNIAYIDPPLLQLSNETPTFSNQSREVTKSETENRKKKRSMFYIPV